MPESNDVDLNALPGEFHDLLPLIRTWAISDDVDREDQVEGASTNELRQLADTLAPRYEAINAYLTDNDHLKEATYLGALAEAGVEAGFEIDRRADEDSS